MYLRGWESYFYLTEISRETFLSVDSASRRRSDNATSSEQRTTSHNDRLSSNSAEEEFKEHMEFLDLEIPHNIDILVISHEDDIDEARKFKKDLLTNVTFTLLGMKRVPVVEIFDEIPDYFAPKSLDNASNRALFIFLYATETFCSSDLEILKGYACLMRALEDKSKQCNVIPIYTIPKAHRNYSLPVLLSGLRPINYWSKEFPNEVKKLLEKNICEILSRDKGSEEKKKEHFAKDPERFRKLKQLTNSMSPRGESSKETKSLADQEPHCHSPSNEVTPLDSAMADMRMVQKRLFPPYTSE